MSVALSFPLSPTGEGDFLTIPRVFGATASMQGRGGLAVYVTSHGFGHLNRSSAVLNLIPDSIPLSIRCHESLFPFWSQRLRRHAALESHVSDSGAVNPPGDSNTTDGPATLALAKRVHDDAKARIEDEASKLRSEGTAAVLCDAPSPPLVAARRAGVPGFVLGNFTWADIYREHAVGAGPEAARLVEEIAEEYRRAVAIFRCEPAVPMTGYAPLIDVGMVVTPGRDRRRELRAYLGLEEDDRIVYSYFGRYGQANLVRDGIERQRSRGIHFVGFQRGETSSASNSHVVPADSWTGADLAASADAVVAKAGYGTVCEAMVAGVPLIYPPRTGFAEHEALERALGAWGGGVPASLDEFTEFRLESHLERALSLRPGPPPFSADGATRVSDYLLKTILSRS